MKLYRTEDGQFHGRRGDAGREAEIVEVATDANGLAVFLNKYKGQIEFEVSLSTPVGEEYTKVVERADPPMSYAEQSVGGDDWFASVPVEHQLTLTQLALENARNEIGRLKSLERGGITPTEYGGVGTIYEADTDDAEAIARIGDALDAEETDPFA